MKIDMKRVSRGAISVTALAAALPGLAQAQNTALETAENDIVVTGSRVARSSTFETATPVTVVGSDFLQKSQPSTLAAALNTLPSLFAQGGPNAGRGNAGGGRNVLDLRSIGQSRTLVLVDGRRFAPSSVDGLSDTNLIPAGVVRSVEVVTGGASAAYGSDAVAGVVNFKLDTGFNGLRGAASYGQSGQDDFHEKRLDLTFGRGFAAGRGHILLSGEYYDNKGVAPDARDFRRNGDSMIRNPDSTGPTFIRASQLRLPATLGGLIVNASGGSDAANAAFRGIQFGPGGTPFAYDYGALTTGRGTTSGNQSGGDGFNPTIAQEIVRPLERFSLFGRADYELTDDLRVFSQVSHGQSRSVYKNSPNALYGSTAVTITRDNAFLPISIRDRMLATGVTSLTLTRYILEGEYPTTDNENATTWLMGGLEGALGGWSWTASIQHGWNANRETKYANTDPAELALAVDAVVNPANGAIACRSTLTSPTNGCVPVNLFGEGSVSQEALNYYNHTSAHRNRTSQTAAEAGLSGDLLFIDGRPLSMALGVEYRRLEASVELLTPYRVLRNAMPEPWKGHYSVKEAFAEAVIPVTRTVELNLAGRVTDYSISGTVGTWKVGGIWSVVPDLRLRATRSRDIRAPNLAEIFEAGRSIRTNVRDPARENETAAAVLSLSMGNPSLKPEKADTLTLGFTYRPSAIPGFGLAIDYYRIEIDGAIARLTAQQLVDQCYAGDANLCGLITRNAAGQITQLVPPLYNFETLENAGVDVEVSYNAPALGGTLTTRALVGWVDTLRSKSPAGLDVEQVGSVGREADGIPHWKAIASADYMRGSWSLFSQIRLVGGGKWNSDFVLGVDTNFNHVSPRAYVDGQISYTLPWGNREASVYLNVQNLLDQNPPFAPYNNNTAQYTNPNLYDEIGRVFRIGFRFDL